MARIILIYGQPGSGKSFSLRNLPPDKTIIIDADYKGELPWRGYEKDYSPAKKNFFSIDSPDKISAALEKIATNDAYKHIRNIIVDGISNALSNEIFFYEDRNKTANKFEKWEQIAKKFARLITCAKRLRKDLTIVFIGHVETADVYSAGDVDKFFVPGQMIKKYFKPESHFLYVFYSKTDGKTYFFETQSANSTARSTYECFDKNIPNDLNAALTRIDEYNRGE